MNTVTRGAVLAVATAALLAVHAQTARPRPDALADLAVRQLDDPAAAEALRREHDRQTAWHAPALAAAVAALAGGALASLAALRRRQREEKDPQS